VSRKPIAIAVIVAGVAFGAYCGVKVARSVVNAFEATSPIPTPAEVRRQFGEGTYVVYEQARKGSTTIDPSQVVVVSDDGASVPVYTLGYDETRTIGSRVYTAVVSFSTPRAGWYTISVRTDGPGAVVIGRSIVDSLTSTLPWVGGIVVGIAMLAGGLVLLLVRPSRERRAVAPGAAVAAPVALAPPGWYPDPADPTRRRYWNGTDWTTFTH
jgi:hypothetical protein